MNISETPRYSSLVRFKPRQNVRYREGSLTEVSFRSKTGTDTEVIRR